MHIFYSVTQVVALTKHIFCAAKIQKLAEISKLFFVLNADY